MKTTIKNYYSRWFAILLFVMIAFQTQAEVYPNSPSAASSMTTQPMKNQYAMVIFFESTCGYCHSFAPVFKEFTESVGIPVYDFTLDGKSIPTFPTPIPATEEIAKAFFENPRSVTVPATFFINVNSQKFVRVSIGNVSSQQLHDSYKRIMNDQEVLEALQ